MSTNNTKRLVVIEDDEVLSSTLQKSLKEAGFSVTLAKDGKEGLQTVQEQAPDLVLLDILLPGLSGLDVLAKLKQEEKTKDIPVLILSQLSDQDNISRAISLGAQGYLVKSDYALEDIVKKVQEFFQKSKTQTSS